MKHLTLLILLILLTSCSADKKASSKANYICKMRNSSVISVEKLNSILDEYYVTCANGTAFNFLVF